VFRDTARCPATPSRSRSRARQAINEHFLSRQTFEADLRTYKRIVANGVLALRFKASRAWA
jgi:hypothetical protein